MTAQSRQIPAPQLRETADIWWDSATDPVIAWDRTGRRFWLVDGADAANRLTLIDHTADQAADLGVAPVQVAEVLRDGLAACDFPSTADGVTPARATATLRAGGLRLAD